MLLYIVSTVQYAWECSNRYSLFHHHVHVPWEGEAGEEHGGVADGARGARRDGPDVI